VYGEEKQKEKLLIYFVVPLTTSDSDWTNIDSSKLKYLSILLLNEISWYASILFTIGSQSSMFK